MNKIYKLVWSQARNCYVVVGEFAKGHNRGCAKRILAGIVATGILNIFGGIVFAAPATNPAGTGPGVAIGVGSVATGSSGSVAVGDNARATGEDAIAVGENAAASLLNAIALGNGASVYPEGGAGINGIAIGTNARSHVMTNGNHEAIITFGRDKALLPGGIAIGTDTHARVGNVEIGNRDYRGLIGDFDLGGKNNREVTSGVASTAVGDNSYAMGNFQSVTGAYNVISKTEDKPTASWAGDIITRGMNALHNAGAAAEGFGAIINGTLNSIEAKEELNADIFSVLGGTPSHPASGFMYSGMANAIVGMANRTERTNGALILGYGNEITNSYLTPNMPVIMDNMSTSVPIIGTVTLQPTIQTDSIASLSTTLREFINDNRLASVSVTGGANKVDYAVFSSVNGVGNELSGKGSSSFTTSQTSLNSATGSGSIFSAFNSIQGYENKGTRVTHTALTGSWNELENTLNSIVIGNNHVLKGSDSDLATGNIIMGFNAQKDANAIKTSAKNVLALGNDTSVMGDNATAIGYKSKAVGANSVALMGNVALGNDSMVWGTDNSAAGSGATVWGHQNSAEGYCATAFGGFANNAIGNYSTAFGIGNTAIGSNATVWGSGNNAIGNSSTAFGNQSYAYGDNSLAALGGSTGRRVLDNGEWIVTGGVNSAAIGEWACAIVDDSIALGSGAFANRLAGQGADLEIHSGYDPSTGVESVSSNEIWRSTQSVIAVGDSANGITRQITGVAAGYEDTDAVNVAQLKAAVRGWASEGMDFAGDDGTIIHKASGQQLDIVGGAKGTLTAGNIGVRANDEGKLEIKLANNINLDTDGSISIGGTSLTNGGLVIKDGPAVTANGIDAGGMKIVNVQAGINPTDAVNVSQLQNAIAGATTEVCAGDNVASVDASAAADGHAIYTVNVDNMRVTGGSVSYDANGNGTLTVVNGEGASKTETQIKGFKDTITSLDKVETALEDNTKLRVSVTADVDGNPNTKESTVDLSDLRTKQGDKNSEDIRNLQDKVVDQDQQLNRLGNRIEKVGAGAAALAGMHPLDYDPHNKLSFSAGFGSYRSEKAAAVGMFYRPSERVMFNLASTVGNNNNMVSMGINFALDRKVKLQNGLESVVLGKAAQDNLRAEVVELKQKNASMQDKLIAQDAEIAELKRMMLEMKNDKYVG